jgi:hypothetical protein
MGLRGVLALSLEQCPQRDLKGRVRKLESGTREHSRHYSLSGEEQCISEFTAEQEFGSE